MDFHLWCNYYSLSAKHWDYLSLLQVTLQDFLFVPQCLSSHGCFPVGTYGWSNVEYWVDGVDFQGVACLTCVTLHPLLWAGMFVLLYFCQHWALYLLLINMLLCLICIFKVLMRLNFFQLLGIFKHLSCSFISPFISF